MARKVKAVSSIEAVQAHRQKPASAEGVKHNGGRKTHQSKLAGPAIPSVTPVSGTVTAAADKPPARPLKPLDRFVSTAKGAKPAKAPPRREPPATRPSAPPSAAAAPSPPHADASHKPTAAAQPTAHWDRATDSVRFDWPAIEQMASRDGPHQGMARLLIAARAQGANSRWPL